MMQFENAVKKFGEIILTELDENKIDCWVAGGSLRDYFMGVPVKTDIDLFFPSERQYDKAKKYFLGKGCKVEWESDNGMKLKYGGKTFDLIKKFFPSPKDTIDMFDFTVSMFAVDLDTVYSGESSFIDLAKRQLMFNKITFPASTLSRSFRYYKKGFVMCRGEMKKLALSLQDMPKPEEEKEPEEEITSGDGVGNFFFGID